MWTRADMKRHAKTMLRGHYAKAFLVSFLLILTGGGGSGSGGGSGGSGGSSGWMADAFSWRLLVLFAGLAVFALLVRLLIGYALEVGGRRFYVDLSQGEADLNQLGFAFRSGRYASVFGTMLLRSVYTFLWALLLIIPGIIKAYAYRMVPYILADNPTIGAGRAIELSRQMMRGEKWRLFVLDLSFIGWYLLGMLALFVGMLFVQPYVDATNANVYAFLRYRAVERGLASEAELNLNG